VAGGGSLDGAGAGAGDLGAAGLDEDSVGAVVELVAGGLDEEAERVRQAAGGDAVQAGPLGGPVSELDELVVGEVAEGLALGLDTGLVDAVDDRGVGRGHCRAPGRRPASRAGLLG